MVEQVFAMLWIQVQTVSCRCDPIQVCTSTSAVFLNMKRWPRAHYSRAGFDPLAIYTGILPGLLRMVERPASPEACTCQVRDLHRELHASLWLVFDAVLCHPMEYVSPHWPLCHFGRSHQVSFEAARYDEMNVLAA